MLLTPPALFGRGDGALDSRFAIICWELETLQLPWAPASGYEGIRSKVLKGDRPAFKENTELVRLIKSCWSVEPRHRPIFGTIFRTLKSLENEVHLSALGHYPCRRFQYIL